MNQDILIRNQFIAIPSGNSGATGTSPVATATIISNMAHYGYVPNKAAADALCELNREELATWWGEVKPVLEAITGSDRNMGDHVVYKNFPAEVLKMQDAELVMRQIAIYFGLPYAALRENAEERAPLGDIARLKVLALEDGGARWSIIQSLVQQKTRWSDNQTAWAKELITGEVDVSAFGFRENGINVVSWNIDADHTLPDGTDVLRLAAAMSDADASLRFPVRYRAFKRAERRRLLSWLDQAKNLIADTTMRPNIWKRLFEHLRPGDYPRFRNAKAAYDDLYNKRSKSFAALIDPQEPSEAMLNHIVQRPGEFLRRFHHFYGLFGSQAVEAFIGVMGKLTTRQLVNFRAYLATVNNRSKLLYPPKGNWAHVQMADNKKVKITERDLIRLEGEISEILRGRLEQHFPLGIDLDRRLMQVKLQTNDQKLAEYGRGTSFDIPDEMTFIRSASFWAHSRGATTWYDNGWNFFADDWRDLGHCGWDAQKFKNGAAIMSGDPVNISDLEGRGCQMIDLYIDKLIAKGVRYAVWSVLCYSREKFSDAKEVLATLQMGENAEKGALYEPSRAQMVFPLKSENYTSYVAYIDLLERKVIFMDAGLRSSITSAGENSALLRDLMPAYVEYLEAIPSVHDLLRDAPQGVTQALYSDAGTTVEGKAFVFRRENPANDFAPMTVNDFLV